LPEKERLLIMAFAERASNDVKSLPDPEAEVLRARGIIEWNDLTLRVYLQPLYWQWLMLNRESYVRKNEYLKKQYPEIQRRIQY
jgi:hypothetical protein